MSNERFFPFLSSDKGKKSSQSVLEKGHGGGETTQIRREMRQIQQLLQEVKMKIATYNVRVDTEYDQDWQWSFRKEAVCQLINFHDWSLCCIQEVRPNQVRDLKAYTTFTCLSAEREGDGQGEGLAILYNEQKVQAIDTGYFWLSETPQRPSIHPEAGCPRIALWGLFKKRLKIRLFSHQCSFGSYFRSCSFSRNDRYLRGVT